MDVEHLALVVAEPVEMAQWYAHHLGMRIVRSSTRPPYGHFLADSSGHVMLEIYNNSSVSVPDYRGMNPLVLHLAFETKDVEADRDRLVLAGATPEGEILHADNGDCIAMLRDPWGLPIQLVNRAETML